MAEILKTEKEAQQPVEDSDGSPGGKARLHELLDDLEKCFKKTGLVSDKKARALGYVTDFLTSVRNYKYSEPENLEDVIERLDANGCYTTKDGEEKNLFDELRKKADEIDRTLKEAGKGQRMEFLDYHEIHQSLEKLKSLVGKALQDWYRDCPKSNKEIVNKAVSVVDLVVKMQGLLETKVKPGIKVEKLKKVL